VLAALCAGLLAPGLHDLGHGDDVWSIARNPAECAQHHAGVHVETGFQHLHHAPCVLCSRTAASGTVVTSNVGIRAEWTRLMILSRAAPAERFHPASHTRGPPTLA
jgi:hypothetical protein